MRRYEATVVGAPLVIFCSFILLTAAHARATEPAERQFDIKRQSLTAALSEFARQSEQEILFAPEVVTQKRSHALRGSHQPLAALQVLLQDSGLEFATTPSGAILVGMSPAAAASARGERVRSSGTDAQSMEQRGRDQAEKRSFWSRLRLAQADQGTSAREGPVGASGASSEGRAIATLEEVIVSAQKRSERLLDVPIPVSAISGERLESLHVKSLADLAGYVPGMTTSSSGSPGFRSISLRGISTGGTDFTGPTVGTYIDDALVGSSTSGGRGNTFGMDLFPFDLERVEVLKGPQGTLYGGNSMGGLVKYTLRKPDLTRFDARFGGSLETVDDSSDTGWNARGTINAPLVAEQLALRLSAFHNDAAGFIDNLGIAVKDSNTSEVTGGRASLLWQATDRLSVQASALAQNIDVSDQDIIHVDPGTYQPIFGRYASNTFFAQTYRQQLRNYSVTVEWDLGFATLISATGWSQVHGRLGEDLGTTYGSFTGVPGAIAFFELDNQVDKLIEEVRLTSSGEGRFQWMLGGYYTKEESKEVNSIPTFTADYEPLPESLNVFLLHASADFEEAAAFANATYELTERFDVSAGVRYSRYEKTTGCQVSVGVFGTGVAPCQFPPATDVATWMGNMRWRLSRDAMLYARVATGYRPGATNSQFFVNRGGGVVPLEVEPDDTVNYEIGFKGQLLDHRLQVEASVFHIDWNDLQQQLTIESPVDAGLVTFVDNAGDAVSDGAELALGYQVTGGLRIDATLAYTDAHVTEDAIEAGIRDGDRLPLSARWTATLAADYTRPLNERVSLILGGGYRYRDDVMNKFERAPMPEPLGDQNIVDLYAGLVMERVTVKLDGKNVFNDDSYTGTMFSPDPDRLRYVPIRPRTLVLSMDYRF